MNHYVTLGIAIVSEIIGTSALKQSDGFTKLVPSVIVLVAFVTAFYFLSLTLKTMPVGIAYAIWSAVGIIAISAIGWALFGQKLDVPAMLGIGLIVSGVIVLNVFSKSAAH